MGKWQVIKTLQTRKRSKPVKTVIMPDYIWYELRKKQAEAEEQRFQQLERVARYAYAGFPQNESSGQ